MTTKETTMLSSRKWAVAAGVRAVKTAAQTAVATIGAGAVNALEVDWATVGGLALGAGVLSVLTSLAGLPEVEA